MLENGGQSGEIGTFPTYFSLLRAQQFLSIPYDSIKTPVPSLAVKCIALVTRIPNFSFLSSVVLALR